MYDSGELNIYKVTETADAGKMPQKTYTLLIYAMYEARTIGVTRFYEAMRAGKTLDYLVRIPQEHSIDVSADICTLCPYSHAETGAFRITQVQQTTDDFGNPCSDISLERIDGLDVYAINSSLNRS